MTKSGIKRTSPGAATFIIIISLTAAIAGVGAIKLFTNADPGILKRSVAIALCCMLMAAGNFLPKTGARASKTSSLKKPANPLEWTTGRGFVVAGFIGCMAGLLISPATAATFAASAIALAAFVFALAQSLAGGHASRRDTNIN